jgi:hypothetical protein
MLHAFSQVFGTLTHQLGLGISFDFKNIQGYAYETHVKSSIIHVMTSKSAFTKVNTEHA